MIDAPTQLKVATSADSKAVSALLAASYSSLLRASYEHDLLDRALPYMIRANEKLLASGTYYVVQDGPGNLIGCGGWTIARPGSGEVREGEAHIRHFATHPSRVRQGVGASLLARCISDARQLGIRRMHCFSTLNGEGFYRTSGFDKVEAIDVPMGPTLKFPGIWMIRELA